MSARCFASFLSLLALACTGPMDEIGGRSDAIVNGTAGGPAAVVVLQNLSNGGLCTGTLIAPRVVLTAKHCVQNPGADGPVPAASMIVGVGSHVNALTSVLRVQSIHTTPGRWTETSGGGLTGDLIGIDVAVMVLQSGVSGVDPIPVRRETHSTLRGQITAVGYGQTPAGQVGVKYTTTGRVQGVRGNLILVGPLTCQGDSGGPAITELNEVGGVVSFGSGGCGTGYGAYNAIYPFLSMIDAALEEAMGCLNNGPEVCDGQDNNCDGMIDETCTAIGGACSDNSECIGLTCRPINGTRRCTSPCDPLRPASGCGPDFYCARGDGCEGWCAPTLGMTAGNLPNDADCTSDLECASLFCNDPGDRRRRCLTPCRGDAGMCLAGEACAAPAGACGGCVPEGILFGVPNGLGENCAEDTECLSGRCFEDQGRSYCTRDCALDSECGNGFHCRTGSCVTGPRGAIGEPCVDNADCHEGHFCATRGGQRWCTRICDTEACPEGFSCVPAGGTMVCAPVLGLVGDACDANEACLSGICAGSAGCTRFCGPDAPCSPGFECRRTNDGLSAVCVAPAAPPVSSGGCSVAPARGADRGSRGPALFVLGLALVGLALRRRG